MHSGSRNFLYLHYASAVCHTLTYIKAVMRNNVIPRKSCENTLTLPHLSSHLNQYLPLATSTMWISNGASVSSSPTLSAKLCLGSCSCGALKQRNSLLLSFRKTALTDKAEVSWIIPNHYKHLQRSKRALQGLPP